MPRIHYHIERPGPRSRYILAQMLGRMAGWEAVEVPDAGAFHGLEGPKLIYGQKAVAGAFRVAPSGLLEASGVDAVEPAVQEQEGTPLLFPVDQGDLSFDVFSAAFFQLARYEEYGPLERDAHGRPLTTALHAARHGYLDRPVVDQWLLLLVAAWGKRDPRLPPLQRTYSQRATMDVDNGAMYLGRSLWRSLGGAARDLLKGRPQRVLDRIATLAGRAPDPYAVHDAFLELAGRNGAPAIFNIITAARSAHDHAVEPDRPFMRERIRALAEHAAIGLHPGYGSAAEPARFAAEKQKLEAVLGAPVTRSRQHFLRFRLPGTFRELERIGIRQEHSMGLADRSGFRAGTCTAFPFYDLHAEEETAVVVHPFAVMDSALCYHMHLSPREAAAEAKCMADAVRRVRGTFISVWHERFLSGYGDEKGWGGLAETVITHARP